MTGTISAGNVSSGTFGSNTGLGNFQFGSSTPILFIDNTNTKVGIGTAGPASKLTVDGGDVLFTGGTDPTLRLGMAPEANRAGVQYNRASGLMSIYNGTGSETRIAVRLDGNVGIGTTNPVRKLTVDSGSASTNANIGLYTGGTERVTLWGTTSTAFAVDVNGSEQFRITGSGNVGIGTTAPTGKLEILDGQIRLNDSDVAHGMTALLPTNIYSASRILNDTAGGMWLEGLSDTGTTSGLFLEGTIGSETPDNTTGIVRFSALKKSGTTVQVPGSSDIAFQFESNTGGTPKYMTILGNGSIGIGTAGPTGKLHVVGDVRIQGTTNTSYIAGSGVNEDTIIRPGKSGGVVAFDVGNVGIGTTNPNVKLYVQGLNSSGNIVTVLNTDWADSSDIRGIGVMVGTAAAYTNPYFMVFYAASGGTQVGRIRLNNNAVAYDTTSDARVKENIRPTALGLETLIQIPVRDFNFINDPRKVQKQGFVAQELYSIYPEAVTVGGADPATQPWGVEYGRLTPLLVKSVQELKEENEELKTKNAELEARVSTLERQR